MANRLGKNGIRGRIYFLGLLNHCRWWLQPWAQKKCAPWKKSYDKPRQHIEEQRHHFADKGPNSQSCGFSSSHIRMWELDHREGRAPKNWCFPTVAMGKTLESPLDTKVIKPVNPKGNQPWISLAGLMLKLKRQCFGHLIWRADALEKSLTLGKTEGRRRGRQRRQWTAGKAAVLQSIEPQRVGRDSATEQQVAKIIQSLASPMVTHCVTVEKCQGQENDVHATLLTGLQTLFGFHQL